MGGSAGVFLVNAPQLLLRQYLDRVCLCQPVTAAPLCIDDVADPNGFHIVVLGGPSEQSRLCLACQNQLVRHVGIVGERVEEGLQVGSDATNDATVHLAASRDPT